MKFNHDNMHGVRLAESVVNMLADGPWDREALQDLLTSHLFRSPWVTPANQEDLREWAVRLQTVFATEDQEARCSAVNALLAGGRAALGVCALRDCGRVVADTGRGGNRAYCSARCGNADAVQRYRGRLRAGYQSQGVLS